MGSVYQFVFTSVRDPASTMLSLSEVMLFDEYGAQVAVREAYNPGGLPGNLLETPQSAIDGSTANKWLDTNFYGEARLQLDLGEPRHVAQYELFSAKGNHRSSATAIQQAGCLASCGWERARRARMCSRC